MSTDAPQTSDTVVGSAGDAAVAAEVTTEEHHDHVSDNRYIVIALILGVITAAEVAASYIELGAAFIPLLLFMMAVKFFIVASFFMHLKFDNKIFTWLFYLGLFLAVGVYTAALTTFRFFNS
jgi:cytochrome c oxidase subunit 4